MTAERSADGESVGASQSPEVTRSARSLFVGMGSASSTEDPHTTDHMAQVLHLPKQQEPQLRECGNCTGRGRLLWRATGRIVLCPRCMGRGWGW